jgi:hypothetical protein
MGITIAYRGRLADLTRIEDFEDRLIDCALEIGASVRVWRTWADANPERKVCGVILDLASGHESTSLLVSPEGWLIGLVDIEDAEEARLKEPPWCFVKTQFGSVAGHVALVEMLAALKREFLPDLEVSDEGGYWETRDFAELVRRRAQMKQAIDTFAAGLRRYGISHEAAEDPDILLRHVERVAEHVHRTLCRPAEHPPVEVGEEDSETEAFDEAWRDDEPPPVGESLADEAASFREADDDSPEASDEERHPLLQKAMNLLVRFEFLFDDKYPRFAPALSTLFQGAKDAMGGLAQAVGGRDHEPDDYGLRVVQLKRALRGAAFARGALFPLRSALSKEQFDELHRTLQQMETDIVSELGKLRSEYRRDVAGK